MGEGREVGRFVTRTEQGSPEVEGFLLRLYRHIGCPH